MSNIRIEQLPNFNTDSGVSGALCLEPAANMATFLGKLDKSSDLYGWRPIAPAEFLNHPSLKAITCGVAMQTESVSARCTLQAHQDFDSYVVNCMFVNQKVHHRNADTKITTCSNWSYKNFDCGARPHRRQ